LDASEKLPNHHGIFPTETQSVEVPMDRKRCVALLRNLPLLAKRLAQPFPKQILLRAARAIGPTLLVLAFSSFAHAQGTISFSGAQTFMQTVQTFAEYAGAVICLIGLIFAGVSFMSGNIQRGVIGLFGAIFGAGVLGWGAGWISSLTGQSVN
jgi:hypothetical protein